MEGTMAAVMGSKDLTERITIRLTKAQLSALLLRAGKTDAVAAHVRVAVTRYLAEPNGRQAARTVDGRPDDR